MHRSMLVALALSLIAAVGCGGNGADTLRIGVAAPMTGGQARNGEELKYGAMLAAKEWNERGGLLGKQIEIVAKDDQAKEQEGPKVANALVAEEVVAVIGHYNSGVTLPASSIYAAAKIPMITPAATNPVITEQPYSQGHRTVFRLCGRDDVQARTAIEFVKNDLGLSRVAILHDKTAYGEGLANFYRRFAEEMGIAVTRFEGFSSEESNFQPYLPILKDGDPELFLFGGIYTQGGPLVLQARENGITIPFLSGDGVFHPEFLAKAGDAAEGSYFTFPDTDSSPAAQEFIKRYESTYKMERGPYAIYAYAAANILFESIQKAGTTDGLQIAEAMRSMEHDTVMGPISFDEKGDVTRSIYTIWKVEGGKYVLARDE